jgi:hypothetical protein
MRQVIVLHVSGYPDVLIAECSSQDASRGGTQAGASQLTHYRIGTISERGDRYRRLTAIELTITVAQKL